MNRRTATEAGAVISSSSSGSAGAIRWWLEPTRDHWLAWIAAWLGWVLDVFDYSIFLLLMVPISKSFDLTLTQVALVLSVTLWMRLPGGVVSGWLADRIGRKKPLMGSILVYSLSNFAAGLSPSYWFLLLFRGLFGLGMGGEWPVGAALAMESWPARSRGFMSAMLQASSNIGILLASLAYGLLYDRIGWRGLLMIGVLPAFFVVYVRTFVTESPLWQENRRRQDVENRQITAPLFSLFKRGMIGNTLNACWWITGSLILFYSITSLFASHLQKDLNLSPGAVATPIAVSSILTFLASLGWGLVADRLGRRWAMIIPATIGALLAPVYLLSHDVTVITVGFMLQGLFGVAVSGQQPAYTSERFPTEIRATAGGFIYNTGAFAAGFVPPVLTWMATQFGTGLGVAMLIGVIFGAANVIVALLFGPETRGKVLRANLEIE
jgi:SHS family lactate transporter-like MFS transporter